MICTNIIKVQSKSDQVYASLKISSLHEGAEFDYCTGFGHVTYHTKLSQLLATFQ